MGHDLTNRIVIITGGSGAIGGAMALAFAKAGARVVIADSRSTGIEDKISNLYGTDRVIFQQVDVCNENSIASLVKAAVDFGGRLDILVTAAGTADTSFGKPKRCHDTDVSVFDKTMEVNVRGLWLCNKYALKQMMSQEPRAPNARGDRTRGWIVNVASVGGFIASRNMPAYITSKHAVVGITRQIALDYAEDRIHVNSLCPGLVRTPLSTADPVVEADMAKGHPWGALGLPEDMASAALFLASDDAQWVTGSALVADGGYLAQ